MALVRDFYSNSLRLIIFAMKIVNSNYKMLVALPLVLLLVLGWRAVALAEAKDEGWVSLFNGKDLTGWYTFLDRHGRNNDPERVFTVENGAIHIYKQAEDGASVPLGYFATETEYSHYHLRFQYKWGKKRFGHRANEKRDSGVMYHCVGPDGVHANTWPRCLECQVQEGDTGDALCIAGTRCTVSIDPKKRDLPPHIRGVYLAPEDGGVPVASHLWASKSDTRDHLEGWNTVEVIVMGSDYAVHIVNGQVNNRLSQLEQQDSGGQRIPLASGKFLFQAELAEVFYRDIAIRPISTGPFRPAGADLPAVDGTFLLTSRAAVVSGPSLRFQPDEHDTLGHWHSSDDKSTWTINVVRPGRYAVELEWSIPDARALNTFRVVAGESSFDAKVRGSGGWWTYKKRVFGQLDLKAGIQQLTIQPAGKFQGALMDIRTARLIPLNDDLQIKGFSHLAEGADTEQ